MTARELIKRACDTLTLGTIVDVVANTGDVAPSDVDVSAEEYIKAARLSAPDDYTAERVEMFARLMDD